MITYRGYEIGPVQVDVDDWNYAVGGGLGLFGNMITAELSIDCHIDDSDYNTDYSDCYYPE